MPSAVSEVQKTRCVTILTHVYFVRARNHFPSLTVQTTMLKEDGELLKLNEMEKAGKHRV